MTDTSKSPHVPAAFINALAEEGSKADAINFLQKAWNELCEIRAERDALQARADAAESEAHACGAEREKWKERAEAAEAQLAEAPSPEAELAAARAIYTPGPRQAVAEYPAQPSPEAVVKAALEWVQLGDNFWFARAPFFGTFRVESYGHGWAASWSVPGFSDAFVDGRFESAEDAIAAINAKVATTIAKIIAQAATEKDRPHD